METPPLEIDGVLSAEWDNFMVGFVRHGTQYARVFVYGFFTRSVAPDTRLCADWPSRSGDDTMGR